jgi:hypothetical protein
MALALGLFDCDIDGCLIVEGNGLSSGVVGGRVHERRILYILGFVTRLL